MRSILEAGLCWNQILFWAKKQSGPLKENSQKFVN